jgi:ABC-type bacteriocin/lantibiotic exporter with double-glycine peptidase domain
VEETSDITHSDQGPGLFALFGWFRTVLGPESSYYWLAIIYGVAVSLLTLALPISVQMLIDTVANTGLVQQVTVIASLLLGLLLVSALLISLRSYVMELFGRKLYARLSAEISIRAVHASAPYFQEAKRDSLFNRFFDIMLLQTNVPSLLTGALPLIFQSIIGFVVVSLYHPYFLVLTLVIVATLALIWQIWGPGAIRTAIAESYAKYETAHQLEALAENNDFFKSENHIAHALARADNHIASYIKANRKHFRRSFAQTVSLLILYASSAIILICFMRSVRRSINYPPSSRSRRRLSAAMPIRPRPRRGSNLTGSFCIAVTANGLTLRSTFPPVPM